MPSQSKTTYFGLPVVRDRVRVADIRRLPFFNFWQESAQGSTMVCDEQGEPSVPLYDWEAFARLFIETGKHRYSK
ncbi:hypothetical protein D3C87_1151940 [compost metagenome]